MVTVEDAIKKHMSYIDLERFLFSLQGQNMTLDEIRELLASDAKAPVYSIGDKFYEVVKVQTKTDRDSYEVKMYIVCEDRLSRYVEPQCLLNTMPLDDFIKNGGDIKSFTSHWVTEYKGFVDADVSKIDLDYYIKKGNPLRYTFTDKKQAELLKKRIDEYLEATKL